MQSTVLYGRHWQMCSVYANQPKAPLTILDLVARGPADIIALAEATPDPQQSLRQYMVSTHDAGKNWQISELSTATAWATLRATRKGFYLYGEEARGKPVQAFSFDGEVWTAPFPAPAFYYQCQRLGCLMEDGWADLSGSIPHLWNRPEDASQPLTDGWAVVGTTLCRVSTNLRCREGLGPWRRPAHPPFILAGRLALSMRLWQNLSYANLVPLLFTGVSTWAKKMQAAPAKGRPHDDFETAEVRILVDTTGEIQQALLVTATSARFANRVMKQMRRPSFDPFIAGGRAWPAVLEIILYKQP